MIQEYNYVEKLLNDILAVQNTPGLRGETMFNAFVDRIKRTYNVRTWRMIDGSKHITIEGSAKDTLFVKYVQDGIQGIRMTQGYPPKNIIPKDILVDFDSTCVIHRYPKIGPDIPHAVRTLKELVANGHNLILFTMRSNMKGGRFANEQGLDDAVQWFKDRDIKLYGVNVNPRQGTWTESPKAYGQVIIDDISACCPLIHPPNGEDRPYVDWLAMRQHLREKGCL